MQCVPAQIWGSLAHARSEASRLMRPLAAKLSLRQHAPAAESGRILRISDVSAVRLIRLIYWHSFPSWP